MRQIKIDKEDGKGGIRIEASWKGDLYEQSKLRSSQLTFGNKLLLLPLPTDEDMFFLDQEWLARNICLEMYINVCKHLIMPAC